MVVVIAVTLIWLGLSLHDLAGPDLSDSPEYVAIEGTVAEFREWQHQSGGRGKTVYRGFSLRIAGDPNWYRSNARAGVHPTWQAGKSVVRFHVPGHPELRYPTDDGIHVYGFWIDGEQWQASDFPLVEAASRRWLLQAASVLCFVVVGLVAWFQRGLFLRTRPDSER